MRMFYAQHNPPIATNAPFIRVIHLRKSKGSFHLNDMSDGIMNHRTEYKLPVYVPYGMVIDILMVDRAMTSYHQGAIRNLMRRGEVAAFILTNRDVVQADIGEIYTVNLTQTLVTVDTSTGAAYVALPIDGVPEGWEIEIKKSTPDTHQIQLDAGSGDIENAGSVYVITGERESVKLTYNLGTWWVLTSSTGAGGIGPEGPQGIKGDRGLSAYEVAVLGGYEGTEAEWLESLKGPGPPGPQGPPGTQGAGGAGGGWSFSASQSVPTSGTLYLSTGGVTTSSAPIIVVSDCTVNGMSVKTDARDIRRSYALEVEVNGTVVESLAVPPGAHTASSAPFTLALYQGDAIAVRMVQTGGDEGKSAFRNVTMTIGPEGVSSRGWSFSASQSVPTSGTLYLSTGGVTTSSAPIIVTSSCTARGASISVDRPDTLRSFDLEVLVNDNVVHAIPLSGTSQRAGFSFLLSPGDEISTRVVKTSGTGKSEFRNITTTLEIADRM